MIRCVLDEDGCIDLLAVMRIMNQIDQEHVWAIAYELAALMQRLWPAGNCAMIESLAQIHINQDGSIHEKSLLVLQPKIAARQQDSSEQQQTAAQLIPQLETVTNTTANHVTSNIQSSSDSPQAGITNLESAPTHQQQHTRQAQQQQQQLPPSPPITPELAGRRKAINEFELVSSLGLALYQTLDYGIPDDEERKLSMTMEYLIFKSQSELTLNEILEICIKRLDIATKTNADLHYRDVCKSLIDDTIQLSIFLDKIYKATMELSGRSGSTMLTANATSTTGNLVDDCFVAAAAAAKRHHSSLVDSVSKDSCDNILGHHHHIHSYHQLASHVHDHHDHLSELSLPLASLRALKIDEWARLWMQVIKEMRQMDKFKHIGITTTSSSQELECSNL